MENEVKVEEPKKKGNGLFTVFACVMTGVIVFLATNLGDKASKVVDPETNSGNTVTSNVTSNVESNVVQSTIPTNDLISYEYYLENGKILGYFFIINNGTLYKKDIVDNSLATNVYDDFNGNLKEQGITKLADNVKRVKTFNLSTDVSIIQRFVMNDGSVKRLKYDVNKVIVGLEDDPAFTGIKVEDILSFKGYSGTAVQSTKPNYTVKLTDGTTKTVEYVEYE